MDTNVRTLDGLAVNRFRDRAYKNAVRKGFWKGDAADYHTKVALIHSEISEVLEAHRKDKGIAAIAEELADVVIRVFDLAGGYDVDLESGIERILQWEFHPPLTLTNNTFTFRIVRLHDYVSVLRTLLVEGGASRVLEKPLARICLGVMELAEYEGVEYFGGAIIRKMSTNEGREYLHGARY